MEDSDESEDEASEQSSSIESSQKMKRYMPPSSFGH